MINTKLYLYNNRVFLYHPLRDYSTNVSYYRESKFNFKNTGSRVKFCECKDYNFTRLFSTVVSL